MASSDPSEIWTKVTRRHYRRILSCPDIAEMRSHCFERFLITPGQLEELQRIRTPREHNEMLYRMLCRGDQETLRTYIEILRENDLHREVGEDLYADAQQYFLPVQEQSCQPGNEHDGTRASLQTGSTLLQDISEYFYQESDVVNLATRLLEGLVVGGGQAYVTGLAPSGTFMSPPEKAFKVLNFWCQKKSGEPSGPALLCVLEKANPPAARNFKDKLANLQ